MKSNLPFNLPKIDQAKETPIWTGSKFVVGADTFRVLEYSENFNGWTDELTQIHEDAVGSSHPIDLNSRKFALHAMTQNGCSQEGAVILEIGCSSGFLIREIADAFPNAIVVGSDVVKEPLYKLADENPQIAFIRFDLTQCPLPSDTFDCVILLNVLEHIENDINALAQIYRILKKGGALIIEVPSGPFLYDSYDKFLKHYRRYSMSTLIQKLKNLNFHVQKSTHLGFFVFPAFFLVKLFNKINPIKDGDVVKAQAGITAKSKLLNFIFKVEMRLQQFISYPFGIRCAVVVKK